MTDWIEPTSPDPKGAGGCEVERQRSRARKAEAEVRRLREAVADYLTSQGQARKRAERRMVELFGDNIQDLTREKGKDDG